MKILIITSEELHPANTFSSCFELSQACALQKKGMDVAILSQRVEKPLFLTMKSLLKKIIFRNPPKDSFLGLMSRLYRGFRYAIKKSIKTYSIYGISVYEGLAIVTLKGSNDETTYDKFIRLGLRTFSKYLKEKGSPDIIHAHSRFLVGSLIANRIKQIFGIKYVITEHSTYYARNLLNDFEINMAKKVIQEADKYITVSTELAKSVQRKLKIEAFAWKTIPNMLDKIFVTREIPVNEVKDRFVFINTAALDRKKNHEGLIKAFSLLTQTRTDCELRIIGYGPEADNCRDLVRRLNLEQYIVFCGQLSPEQVKRQLLDSNALVLSSDYETFGVVVIEALACGRPVVSTICGGPEDIIDDTNGILVEKNNPEKLCSAMERMMTTIAHYNCRSIRETCIAKYGPEKIAEDIISVYKTVCSPRVSFKESKRNSNYKICTRCVMDTSDSSITFDDKGVCNYCHYVENMFAKPPFSLNVQSKYKVLEEYVAAIKKDGNQKRYDCVIGVSGGVDSTYVAYKVKELGLRPLAVHLDNGWNSELAVQNIENICRKLDIDLFTYVINWEEFKDLQLSFLKASTPDSEIPSDYAINSILTKCAGKNGIRHIISGGNQVAESIMPQTWSTGHSDWVYIKNIQENFGTIKLKTFPHINLFMKRYYSAVHKLHRIDILDYLDYDREEAKRIIIDRLGWRDYGGKHNESLYTKFYQAYILPVKFGIDKRRAHFASLICSEQMKRDDALELLKKSPYDVETIHQDIEYVTTKFGISIEEFERIMKLPPKTYWDYPNQTTKMPPLYGKYMFIKNILKLK
jgi:N-acetyl sugar amidotransferase